MPLIVPSPVAALGFEGLKQFRKLRNELRKLTGNDAAYYGVLGSYRSSFAVNGFQHANEICPVDAQKVMNALIAEKNWFEWVATEEQPEPKRKKKVRLFGAFDSAEQFDVMRQHLRHLTGSDDLFAAILKRHGFDSVDAIPNHDAGAKPYREMCAERNGLQLDRQEIATAIMAGFPKEVVTTLQETREVIGRGVFYEILGVEFRVSAMEEIMRMPGEQLEMMLLRLKSEVDSRRTAVSA